LLRTFDLAIEVGSSGAVRPELNAIVLQGLLKDHPEKFTTAICLDSLNRKRKLFDHAMLQEVNRIAGGTPGIQAKHPKACAIIDGGILEAASADFHRIDLNAVTRQWTAVPSWFFRRAPTDQWGSLVGMKNFPNRGSGQAKSMMAQ
jgi:hypothetical protein